MGTNIRSELSKKNDYYIPKHRYYELKHFCLQYSEWKRAYDELCEFIPGGIFQINQNRRDVENKYYLRERYINNIDLIEKVAGMTDPILGAYILKAVTEGKSYEYFKMNTSIPCCKDVFYRMYRRFFWILSKQKS